MIVSLSKIITKRKSLKFVLMILLFWFKVRRLLNLTKKKKHTTKEHMVVGEKYFIKARKVRKLL